MAIYRQATGSDISGWPKGLRIENLYVYDVKELDTICQSLPNISFKAKLAKSGLPRLELYNELLTALQRFPDFLFCSVKINWKKVFAAAPELKLEYTKYRNWTAQDCKQVKELLIDGLIPRLEAQKNRK